MSGWSDKEEGMINKGLRIWSIRTKHSHGEMQLFYYAKRDLRQYEHSTVAVVRLS